MKQEMTEWQWLEYRQSSASRSSQITTPAPYYSIFTGRMLFLRTNQQCQSTQVNIWTHGHYTSVCVRVCVTCVGRRRVAVAADVVHHLVNACQRSVVEWQCQLHRASARQLAHCLLLPQLSTTCSVSSIKHYTQRKTQFKALWPWDFRRNWPFP